ncbi:alpha,alpha-trehalose-phosphate synthase (UDP-forming) [Luteococcus sp. Sow4_B9]|uniref:alpha,alpha-trehalose-phosphate synthase (UDP-forming) n=1 Tax=Luteococcus sp. Sow4_B9 TaxID=3438792 RepID=UPI003F962DE7
MPETTSTPQTADFLVVANRLPVDRRTGPEGELQWRTSPGGLVTALEPVMKRKGGAWIGWHGAPDETIEGFEHEGYSIVPVPLSSQDVEEFYEGFSNATLWPLYHDVVVPPVYHREWWQTYREVNQRFAQAAAAHAAQGATVWVQDYQLHLVPAMLRELRPDLRIGFFLHIPFPPKELYQQLPWRRELLEGLLGADLIGFQLPGGATNFVNLAKRLVGVQMTRDRIRMPDGRVVLAKAYPISIDANGFRDLAREPDVQAEAAQLREDLGNPKRIFLGVDRLDYTKGLRQRIRAFGELFSSGELDPDENVFLQVATPSRERVEEYRKLRDDIDLLVGRINSEVGRIGSPAIAYRHDSYPRTTMAAMYSIADVMVVTPLRDGMNLVAKEYVACHEGDDAALVLSEFAGAAKEMKQAYQCNPHDLDGMKETIMRAANDSTMNRSRRMRLLRKQVFSHQIDDWANDFLRDLGA